MTLILLFQKENYPLIREETWCNLIDDNKISMQSLLDWNEYYIIVFFYPYQYLNVDKFKILIEAFQQKTKISFNNYIIINEDEGKAIAEALKITKTLTQIELIRKNLNDNVVIPIAEALKKNNTLLELIILYNNISYNGVKAIAEALKINTKLTFLWLDSKMIGYNGAIEIAKALKKNKTL